MGRSCKSSSASSGVIRRPNNHPARARDGEQVAVPGGLSRVGAQGAVGAMIVDEVFKVGEKGHVASDSWLACQMDAEASMYTLLTRAEP